jgi:N-methylhydantoinase B
VVLLEDGDGYRVDGLATDAQRASLRSRRSGHEPFFDRGPGYRQLSGREYAEVDFLES